MKKFLEDSRKTEDENLDSKIGEKHKQINEKNSDNEAITNIIDKL